MINITDLIVSSPLYILPLIGIGMLFVTIFQADDVKLSDIIFFIPILLLIYFSFCAVI